MVGTTGIEPVTPSMSRKCSPAELRALTPVSGGVTQLPECWQAGGRSSGEEAVDLVDELAQMKGLRQHRRLAARDAAMAQGNGGEAGDEHDAEVGPQRAGAGGEFDTVEAGHDHV